MNVGDLRQDYQSGALRRSDLAANPFAQFERWFTKALADQRISEANAMTLATAGKDGQVKARTVLLKDWDARGFVFFTNYQSAKALQIADNAQVALLFAWLPMERQIAIAGRAEKIPREESLAYFQSRPLASQLGAWASEQSRVLASREELEEKYTELQRRFEHGEVPMPDFWGGYRVEPETLEYWQGRTSRLHDRFLYSREGDAWKIERLSP